MKPIQFRGKETMSYNKAESPLPPAEGAEEIDDETIAYAAEYQCGTPFSERWIGFVKGAKWHRSLHAQKIADKMVSERLRETTERCKKLEFMIDKGLGWKDMENDITMPHEL